MLGGLAADAGLHFTNLGDLDTFGEDEFSRYRLNPIDGHPNEAAHAIFAGRLQDVLDEFLDGAPGAKLSLRTLHGATGP